MTKRPPMHLGPIDYNADPPAAYHCSECKRAGVKLWRQYNTFADHVDLLCCDCAGRDQHRDVTAIDRRGRLLGCDQIGNLMPAVPTEDGETFWGYTSVPDAGVDWWKRLPNRVE